MTLDGRTVVFAVDFPGPTLFDGNATARLYIDDGANADQRRELEAICSGTKGGPMGALAPLIAKWLPARIAKIDVAEADETITVTVANAGRVKSQRLRDPQACSIEKQQDGEVAGANPLLAGSRGGVVGERHCLIRRCRTRQGPGAFGGADARTVRRFAGLHCGEGEEGADGGNFAGRGGGA